MRLHSTYRHDLKIYSSDEGRVQVGRPTARTVIVGYAACGGPVAVASWYIVTLMYVARKPAQSAKCHPHKDQLM